MFLWCPPHPPTGHNPIYGTEPHIRVIRPLDALKYTQTIRQAVTLSQGYQKATMGRMSNLICLKHVKINNQQRNIILERRSVCWDEMNISPARYLLDISSECEIGPFSGSIRNVVGERKWRRSGGRKVSTSQEERGGEAKGDKIGRERLDGY